MHTSTSELRDDLRRQLAENAYPGYVYGYPHKKAYRPLPQPVPLAAAWAEEDCAALFCYVHLPFCNQRCSFCNLFTHVPAANPVPAHLDALAREADAYAKALGPSFRFDRLYLGGGTPTYLTTAELVRLVGLLNDSLGVRPSPAHGSIEASPETIDDEKLAALRELGFERVSLGIQSLAEAELRAVNRRFEHAANARALDLVGATGFRHFNVDLIYGLPGQTAASWLQSLEAVLASRATSVFLYPLYVRPLTGLERRADSLDAPTPREMGHLYDLALGRLEAAGFRQRTMREFCREEEVEGECLGSREYRCAWDGMVGLGAGARSYTARLHYSTPWKMVTANIRAVIDEHGRRLAGRDSAIRHGFVLDEGERRRRFAILSLLEEGLSWSEFRRAFGVDAGEEFAELWEALEEEGLVEREVNGVRLTRRGLRHADVVGQLFFSGRVRELMDAFEYDA